MIGKRRAYEELLVSEARLGHRAAIEALVRLRGPRLLVHATRLLGDRDAAQDAVQDAWVDILRGLPGLRSTAAFPAWATRIVSRRCAGIIDKRVTARALAEGLQVLAAPETAPEPDPQEDLHRALAQLPPGQAAAMALFYLEDMRLAEVAVALDVPVGTVKSRLSLARKTLKEMMKGDEQ